MDSQKLTKYIFNGFERIYAVLDGASVPDLRDKLYEMQPEYFCLYRGELEPDMAEVAPYIIRVVPNSYFSDWLFETGWGKHWGIFVQSHYSLAEMRKHLRKFLTVHDESGKPLLFRFYDPRVFRTFLPTCTNKELKDFFGLALYYALEDENPENILNYLLSDDELKINHFEIN